VGENLSFEPVSLEAEQAILGSVLLQPKCVEELFDLVEAEDFYLPKHRKLYTLYMHLYTKYQAVELNLLKEEIQNGRFSDIEDSYLRELINNACSPTLLSYYAKIVKKKSKLRKLIMVCKETLSKINEGEEPEVLLEGLEQAVFNISEENARDKVNKVEDVLQEVLKVLEERSEGKNSLLGIPTGFEDIDSIIGGLANSNFIVVAGRPSMGKTSFVLNLAYNIASRGSPVLFFSLEAEQQLIVHNLLCSIAGVNTFYARKGALSAEEKVELNKAASILEELPIYIDNSKNLTPFEIRLTARRCQRQYGIKAIFIDYLQLISAGQSGLTSPRIENRQQEIAFISRALKILATELNVPVIAVAQLSRNPELREGHRPVLADLRESGAIEQDADVVMLLYREEYYLKEKTPEDRKGMCEVIVAKNRYGPTDVAVLKFNLQTMKFENKNAPAFVKD
jgi:replicative DNA helicase